MGNARVWCWGLLLAVACGGRTEGFGSPLPQSSGGSATTDAEAGQGTGAQSVGGTASMVHVGGAGGAGNTVGGAAGAGPVTGQSLQAILPLFTPTGQCQACVSRLCPNAAVCGKGSVCLRQMQCVVNDCRANAPRVTDDPEGDASACVSLYAACRDHLADCGLSDGCVGNQSMSFQLGLGAVDCLQARCYGSCQR